MTGKELAEWIKENGAENYEVLFLQEDATLKMISPEIVENEELKDEFWSAVQLKLPDKGRCIVL